MHQGLEYRPHIDGMRAIAVGGVVLFHFGLTPLSGGFTGVDVFFVISGFLISKTLYRDVAGGDFSFADFYARRARRIVPAYVAVSLLSTLAAGLLLYPHALRDFAASLLASTVFASNIYFYFSANYFAPAAHELPLLHYWSLGVEEQFYLLFPPLLFAARRCTRRRVPLLLAVVAVASLLSGEMLLRFNPEAAFYLLPFRAFELLIGCLLALPGVRFPAQPRIANGAVLLGLALILGGMVALSERGPFPGTDALLPCAGAALVIWGADRVRTGAGARLLSLAPLRFVGRISYSFYLVHWPVASFGRQLFPFAEGWEFFLGGVATSLLFAVAIYALVEAPCRRWLGTVPRALVASTAGLAVLAALAGTILALGGFPQRVEARVLRMLTYVHYRPNEAFRTGTCFLGPRETAESLRSDPCLPARRPLAVLWGDSHAAHYYAGLEPLFAARGYALGQLTASGCPPLPGIAIPARPNCAGFNDFALAEILRLKPQLVVMAGFWSVDQAWLDALEGVLSRLDAAGIRAVVLGPGPVFRRSVPLILADRQRAGDRGVTSGDELSAGVVEEIDAAVQAVVTRVPGARYVPVLETICPQRQCPLAADHVPLFFDNAHLTAHGAHVFSRALIGRILP